MPLDPSQFDFFVSCAHDDNSSDDDRGGWITQFLNELLAEHKKLAPDRPLKCFFDQRAIRSLDDWRQRIRQALRESH